MNQFEKLLSTFPQLNADIRQNVVKKYSTSGILELTQEDKNIIAEIETKGKRFCNKVFCVIDSIMFFGDTEVDVTSYAFTNNEFMPYEESGCLVVDAKCYNHTWDLDEIGIIGIRESDGIIIQEF